MPPMNTLTTLSASSHRCSINMKLADFDYHLPADSIAQFPLQRRDGSRLMVIDRTSRTFQHARFSQIGEFLPDSAMLVLNDTKVMPARLIGKKLKTGGKIEFLLVREKAIDARLETAPTAQREAIDARLETAPTAQRELETAPTAQRELKIAPAEHRELQTAPTKEARAATARTAVGGVCNNAIWEVLAKPQRSLKVGTRVSFGDGELIAEVVDIPTDGHCQLCLSYAGDFADVLARVGQVPLPPYIKRAPTAEDVNRYQCVYAEAEGAIAAPTAGLHFTQELLEKLRNDGIETATLTLHVGIGTFQPVKVEEIASHRMHAESIHLSAAVAARLRDAREAGRKIVAVGTTVVRALETAGRNGTVTPYRGESELFIYPGHQFNVVDALITNFHLPKSTLLMLVSAFADVKLIRAAYQEALRQNYRFYSYGDAMLIL
ncbi:tRNA preQ1(34) S-adenosylmethionine ribosyltransferase-isomerase QueA [Candidatus Poribacteria bacterium]|nr:MAG: tRNA preQ1(34) S-adenosylmethionine ribosyltransferase-isomerase QueA [Candidatus Poribacteria bacterium]